MNKERREEKEQLKKKRNADADRSRGGWIMPPKRSHVRER